MNESVPTQPAKPQDDGSGILKITYVIYLGGLIIPILTIVGLIMAYINRGDAAPWIAGHYRWLIRTFWISLLWGVACGILMIVHIGWILLLVAAMWSLVRVVRGFSAALKKQPIANPASWGF
jgi:uncharacterized membrane protein